MKVINFSLIILLIISCSSSKDLDNWVGSYEYNEPPVKALAGYNMFMTWNLDIEQEKSEYIGKLEISGQQTYIVIQTLLKGDKNKVNLIFDKTLDGVGFDYFKKGDKLLELRKVNGMIITQWKKLTPLLLEKFKNDTICFVEK